MDRFDIPDLPYTKDYHLFICYTESDTTSVREIVDYLEAEGLKCCFNERDFKAGKKIIHSINDAIKQSTGTIIILSEDSVNSNFCKHEIDLAVHTSITEGYTIIPIKIGPCATPETLKEITYINAQNKESSEIYLLVLNAFLHNVWEIEQERTNGFTHSIPLTKYTDGFLKRLSLWKYKLLVSKNERQSIRMEGFNVSDARFDVLQFKVSSSFHVQYKHFYENLNSLTELVFLMLALFIVSLVYVIKAAISGQELDSTTLMIIVISLIWVFTEERLRSFMGGLMDHSIVKSKKKLNMKLWWRFNKETIRIDNFFVFYRDGYLDIVRFDPKPCQVVFERRCRNLKSLTKLVTPGEGETGTEYTERLFESYLQQNFTRLTVTSNVNSLHEMKNGASCLCTLLENDILKQDQNQL